MTKVTVRKHKEHSVQTSAFAIGEHAELRLDFLKRTPFFHVTSVNFTSSGITYDIAVAVNAGTDEKPLYEYHDLRPITGVDGSILKKSESDIPNFLLGKFPFLDAATHQVGDVVELDLFGIIFKHDIHAIPVLVWGVRYTEGKVCYDLSIDCDQYRGTTAYDKIYERYLKHSLDNVDGIFVQPVGGWEYEEVNVVHRNSEPQFVEIKCEVKK